jgi:hypothetical protein
MRIIHYMFHIIIIYKIIPITYEDIDTTIKDVLANKIKKEHLTNYLKHSYRIYK